MGMPGIKRGGAKPIQAPRTGVTWNQSEYTGGGLGFGLGVQELFEKAQGLIPWCRASQKQHGIKFGGSGSDPAAWGLICQYGSWSEQGLIEACRAQSSLCHSGSSATCLAWGTERLSTTVLHDESLYCLAIWDYTKLFFSEKYH